MSLVAGFELWLSLASLSDFLLCLVQLYPRKDKFVSLCCHFIDLSEISEKYATIQYVSWSTVE